MFKRLNHLTTLVENGLMALLLTSMILLAASQIVMRNVWDTGLAWSDPLLRIMVLWLGLLGAMAATRGREHISIDILSRFLPPCWKKVARLITDLFSAAICALIAYHGTLFVLMEKEDGMIAFGSVPAWLCESIIPIGFAIMALRFLTAFILGLSGAEPNDASGEEALP